MNQKGVAHTAKILVVEDNPDFQELLTTFLIHAGHDVTAAGDADEARKSVSEHDFDLYLLDVMLPGTTDGFGLCAELKQQKDIPVMMLTALDDEAHQLKGYELDIDEYITKPVSMPPSAISRRSLPTAFRISGRIITGGTAYLIRPL